MIYQPVSAVWEITMACTMPCRYCGYTSTTSLPGELSTEEAFNLCDQIGELGVKQITLSGGEPMIRPDWDRIAERFALHNVISTIITDGWLVDDSIVQKAEHAMVNTMAVRIDGLRATHDFFRRPDSFDHAMGALDRIVKSTMQSSVITTVTKKNLGELPELLIRLGDKGVTSWYLQISLPTGCVVDHHMIACSPECVDTVIDFAYAHYHQAPVTLQLADCIGYFNDREIEVRKSGSPDNVYGWQGCVAGKRSLGILHDGSIVGCTSIRDQRLIEGTIRDTSLRELWERPTGFRWNREMQKEKISGFCGKCRYGTTCLGGCASMRLAVGGSVYSENAYCSYHRACLNAEKAYMRSIDASSTATKARRLINAGNHQLAESLLHHALAMYSNDRELLILYGYVSYMLENYDNALMASRKALGYNNDDRYANKGMGLTLYKLGNINAGDYYLKRALRSTDDSFMDLYSDLTAVVPIYEPDNQPEGCHSISEA